VKWEDDQHHVNLVHMEWNVLILHYIVTTCDSRQDQQE
jgi:hypothetical protein